MNAKKLQQQVHHALLVGQKNRRKDESSWSGLAIRGNLDEGESFAFNSGDLELTAHPVKSLLEMRALLQEANDTRVKKVFLVDFETRDFPSDIKARLLSGTMQEIDSWQMILNPFSANRFDKRIVNSEEVLDVLLHFEPFNGYEKAPAGYLSYDHFWSSISSQVLKFETEMDDSSQLLLWAMDASNAQHFLDLHSEVQQHIYRWLETKNAFVSLVLKCTIAKQGADLIPLGLVSTILFSSELGDNKSITRAQVKFEQRLGLSELSLPLQRQWASSAKEALDKVSADARERYLNRGDQLVEEFGLKEVASESDVLISGFSQRIVNFAEQCETYLKGTGTHDTLQQYLLKVLEHQKCQTDTERTYRMEMLVRLMRWLKTEETQPEDFQALCREYRTNLSYVDLARGVIGGGDSIAQLQEIYSKVATQCLERRERFNQRYGEAAIQHSWKPKAGQEVMGIERVLDEMVSPLAENHKCLVLVMDGMSWAVADELIPDFDRSHWTLRSNEALPYDLPSIISTVPSVTEHGRMSLLSGRLAQGHQGDEKQAFAEHSGMKKMIGSGAPPKLFHKAELENVGRTGLTQDVRGAIENVRNKVVGVVINAIDDHLAKDDMKLHRWKLSHIRLLESILESAKASKRVVIMCSDHGHIDATWSKGTQSPEDGGERWQPKVKDMTGCLEVPTPHSAYKGKQLVACWSEQRHFGVKKNGYHGGVSPQELMAPCVVLAQMGESVKGWTETRLSSPGWWLGEGVTPTPVVAPVQEKAEPEALPSQGVDWLNDLMESEIFVSSCKQAGRRRPKDAQIQTLLTVLENASGHQVPVAELGRALEMPDVRMRGLMAQISMLLNLEGYQIIEYTSDGKHIRLNKELLFQQFGLE